MDAVSIEMHIHRANEITVAAKAALAARPVSASGLVLVPAPRTPAAGSSFGAGRARDAGLFRFVREVVDVTAVFPLRHAAIMVTAGVSIADAVRVADEERPDAPLETEVDDLVGGLMPKVADTPFGSPAHLVLRPLEFLPASRVFLAPALLFGKLPELFAPLPFEAADAAPGHDEGFAGSRGDGGQVDFPEIDRSLHRAGSHFRLRYLDADVQLEAPVPDERAGPSGLGKGKRQDERRVAFAHRQDHTPHFLVDGLRGPLDGVEAFCAPGILHADLGMLPAQGTCGFNGRERCVRSAAPPGR